ncbi:hypothetical protein BDQ94DRAFT_157963 [Aspergillus welwitschiae]|uniref:Secreted protein n=1 Tax=Aspergillus welwitschiae TaxID=1341132 RepID=A0A3F3Q9A3_9EURO|nr:hypothetical protein BDQ94DRAFT_157963 [Aspergillus welwitschiae]RDH35780.1 hypothetical protein BDQ94DRAFT_157963 [Aspergillus welwitschiae]
MMPLLRLSLLFLSDKAHGDGHTRPPLITARSRKSSRAKWEVHQRRNVSVQASLARKQWTLFIAPFVRSSIQLSATSNYRLTAKSPYPCHSTGLDCDCRRHWRGNMKPPVDPICCSRRSWAYVH